MSLLHLQCLAAEEVLVEKDHGYGYEPAEESSGLNDAERTHTHVPVGADDASYLGPLSDQTVSRLVARTACLPALHDHSFA